MITIGADPELMIINRLNDEIVSAAGLIGGTKDDALPMEGLPQGFAVQEDNVMVEYNIPPQTCARDFSHAVGQGLDWCRYRIMSLDSLYSISREVSAVLKHDQLQHPNVQTFGCSPDYDAYDEGKPAPRIDPNTLRTGEGAMRFNGGHVHIGLDRTLPKHIMAQFADVFIGLRLVEFDKQGERRTRYGTAGRYRPTTYGFEYRTLSNFWIHSSGLRKLVGSSAMRCGEYLEGTNISELKEAYAQVPWVDVKTAIDNEDRDLASRLYSYLTSVVPRLGDR